MTDDYTIWQYDKPFELESGDRLKPLQLTWQSWGKINAARDNVLLISHALTGNTDVASWWGPLLGKGKPFDTDRYFIICINILGSPYGSTSPLTFRNEGLDPTSFPRVTIRDVVRSQKLLLDCLEIPKIQSVIGGSLGGMLSLEWALLYPDFVKTMVTIGSTVRHSAWCIGLSAMQRDAIRQDPAWNGGHYAKQPTNGLSLARKIAMASYRSAESFEQRFHREQRDPERNYYQVESYLDYQGQKLVQRFDANCYLELTGIMDTHDIGFERDGIIPALESIQQPTLVVSIDSDILYIPEEQQLMVKHIPNSEMYVLESIHGHDAFLIEFDQMEEALSGFGTRFWMDCPENNHKQCKIKEHAEVS